MNSIIPFPLLRQAASASATSVLPPASPPRRLPLPAFAIPTPAVPEPTPVVKLVDIVTTPAPASKTLKQGQAAMKFLKFFMNDDQHKLVLQNMRGEEGSWFIERMCSLAAEIQEMPGTYGQKDAGDNAVAHLHYFIGGCDWWITEKDSGGPKDEPEDKGRQLQAFGVADLGHGPELGYISIEELKSVGAELDFHFSPVTVGKLLSKEQPTSQEKQQAFQF